MLLLNHAVRIIRGREKQMRADKIIVEPFLKLVVDSYKGIMQINEHGEVNIEGNIPIEMLEEYFALAKKEKMVKITASEMDGGQQTLFYGYLTDFDIAVAGHTATVKLQIKTGTYLMTQRSHIRTFQDKEITYDSVLATCNKLYNKSAALLTEGKGKKISEFIIQYQENDWNFIKRLASRLNTVVVPDTKTGGVKYYFGLPNFTKQVVSQNISYKVCRDLEEYEYKKANGIKISEDDCVCYALTTREVYELGNRTEFLGKLLFIYRIESEMRGSELYHTYYLKSLQGLKEIRKYNYKMIGAGLKGTVKRVEKDKIQVKLKDDENCGATGYRWFPFSTVYSSPDGTGWYCMPEQGDTVRLCFPSEIASDAYVSSAVHEYSGARTNPELKYLRNRHGKEICLAPDHIMLTNNKGTYIEISDRKGIRMKSTGSIVLQANGKVAITSETDNIQLNAKSGIRLKQRDAVITIKEDIILEGMHVKLH